MIKEMPGWKVITTCTSYRCSYYKVSRYNVTCVEYPVNVRVYPKIKDSLLFFFKVKSDAEKILYWNINSNRIIVPCIAYDCEPMKYMGLVDSYYSIKEYWKSKKNKKPIKDIELGAPYGTWGAKSIKCLE
jgi:hypothetical protein